VRTKVNKVCAILTLALLPAAVGCAASSVAPVGRYVNPAIPEAPNEHFPGKKDPYRNLFCVDKDGFPYPDPFQQTLDADRFERAGCSLQEYYKDDPAYDPDQIFDDLAVRLVQTCGSDRTLIVLIHGFCSTMPESRRSYKAARLEIEHLYPTRKFAYLEVYWDGLYGSPIAIWEKAQGTSKWAGIGLRRLLSRLPASLPVRVITHSRGAAVICSALWNVDPRISVAENRQYRAAQQKFPTPVLPGLRIGLLAPAMTPADLESYFERGTGAFCFHDRIILGINPDDYALNCGGLSHVMGTWLGRSPEVVDSEIAPRLNQGRALLFRVDFSGSVEHAFEDYAMRDAFEDEFLPKLLGEPEEPPAVGR
jgi:hypothetical protein